MSRDKYREENIRRIEKVISEGGTELDLVRCDDLNIIEPYKNQIWDLKSLCLSRSNKLKNNGVTSIRILTELRSLDLSWCWKITNKPLKVIGELKTLCSLKLTGCNNIRSSGLEYIANLKELISLDLDGCSDVGNAGLESIGCLIKLRELKISKCPKITDDGVLHLSGLSELCHLDLSFCGRITDLSLQTVSKLIKLQSLSLIRCNQITDTGLKFIKNLSELRILNLFRCYRIGNGGLTSICKLAELRKLDISWCKNISDVSDLAALTKLRRLYLSGCVGLKELPRELLYSKSLKELYFKGGEVEMPEYLRQICNQANYNCLEDLRAYYSDLDNYDVELDREVKLLFVGNGRAGKTTICRVMNGEECDPDEKTTHGVEFFNWKFEVEGYEDLQVNAWDFGGQDIYYGTNRMFHHGQAVFVLVWDPEFPVECDDGHGGVYKNYSLKYWIEYIRSVDKCAHVISVCNNKTGSKDLVKSIREYCIRAGYEYSSLCGEMSITEVEMPSIEAGVDCNKEVKQMQDAIKKYTMVAAEEILGSEKRQETALPRLKVKEEIIKLTEEGKKQYLTRNEFSKICVEMGLGESSQGALLRQLHTQGILYYDPKHFGYGKEDMKDLIVIDQRWASDAIFAIFDRKKFLAEHQAVVSPKYKGQFTLNELARMCWAKKTFAEQALLLRLMVSAGICFDIGCQKNTGRTVYLAPGLLRKNEAEYDGWSDDSLEGIIPIFWRYSYNFVCPSILNRAMIRLGKEYKAKPIYWESGFILPVGGFGEGLKVQKTIEGDDGAGVIDIEIRAKKPYRLLYYIRQYFEEDYKEAFREYQYHINGYENTRSNIDIDMVDYFDDDELIRVLDGVKAEMGVEHQVSVDGMNYVKYNDLRMMRELGNKNVTVIGQSFGMAVKSFNNFFHHYKAGAAANKQSDELHNNDDNTEIMGEDESLRVPSHLGEDEEVVFSWLHLSDLHVGHGDEEHREHQANMMKRMISTGEEENSGLRKFLEEHSIVDDDFEFDALFFSGDLAQSGCDKELQAGIDWLNRLMGHIGIDRKKLYVVPGNHDLVRLEDQEEGFLIGAAIEKGRMLSGIDEVLGKVGGKEAVLKRFDNYYNEFNRHYGDGNYYYLKEVSCDKIAGKVKIAGLNSSLLCMKSKEDPGMIELGAEQRGVLKGMDGEGDINICISHHPANDGWLKDQDEVQEIFRENKIIHVCGHTHKKGDKLFYGGKKLDYLESLGAAAHDGEWEGMTHGIKVVMLVRNKNDNSVVARSWPIIYKDDQLIIDEKEYNYFVSEGSSSINYYDRSLPGFTGEGN